MEAAGSTLLSLATFFIRIELTYTVLQMKTSVLLEKLDAL